MSSAEIGQLTPAEPLEKVGPTYIWLLVLAQFGVFLAFITPLAISLSIRLAQLAPGHEQYLGYITGAGAAVVVVVGVVSLLVMALAPSVLVLGLGWVLAQLGWGSVLGALFNSQADRLPEEQRGKVAGLAGFATLVAPVAGVVVAGQLARENLLLFWERWDAIRTDGTLNPSGMASHNHYALGAVADWLHRVVGGLSPTTPGYRTMRIAPAPGGGLTHDTVHGRVMIGRGLRLDVTIPEGTTATVVPPLHPDGLVEEVAAGRHTWEYGLPETTRREAYTMDTPLRTLADDPAVWRAVTDVFGKHFPACRSTATPRKRRPSPSTSCSTTSREHRPN